MRVVVNSPYQTYWQRAQRGIQESFSACCDIIPSIFKKSLSGIPKGLAVGTGSAIAGTIASRTNLVITAVAFSGLILIKRPIDQELDVSTSFEAVRKAANELFSPISKVTKLVETSVGAATTIAALATIATIYFIHPIQAVILSPMAGKFLGNFIISKIEGISREHMHITVLNSAFISLGSTAGFCSAGVPGALVGGAAAGYVCELLHLPYGPLS